MKWDAEVDDSNISVGVTNGAVTLTGHVPTFSQNMSAAKAVKRVVGALALVNELDVLLESKHLVSDESLAERIANILKWNLAARGKNIVAEVKSGIVTLTGEVDWQYQRTNILKSIEQIRGFFSVVNLIKLKPHVTASDVQQKIKEALKRHANVEASKISVTVANGTATLSGTVESLEELDRVEAAVWSAAGVSSVVDNLRVA